MIPQQKNRKKMSPVQSNYAQFKKQFIQKTSQIKYNLPIKSSEIDPTPQIYNPYKQVRKILRKKGEDKLKQNKPFGIVIFAGGYGSRSQLQQSKQFYQFKIDNKLTSLFNIAQQSLKPIFDEYQKMITLYIVCSRKNSDKVFDSAQTLSKNYPDLTVYLCYQPELNVLCWNGVETVYKNSQQNYTYPSGIGAFRQAKLYLSTCQLTLQEHILDKCKPQFVYCIGTSNLLQQGIDYEMIGLLASRNLSCVFRCAERVQNEIQQVSLVCIRKNKQNKPAWLVMQHKNLAQLTKNKQISIQRFPIWLENFVFNPRILKSQHPLNDSQLKYQFNSRTLTHKQNKLIVKCRIAEYTLSYALLRDKQKCVGYMNEYINEQKKQFNQTNFFLKTAKNISGGFPSQLLSSINKLRKR